MSGQAVPRKPSVTAAAQRIPRSVESEARLLAALKGLSLQAYPGVFDSFVHQCRAQMSLSDVEAAWSKNGQHQILYFGVCLSGVCVLRLAVCFVDFLRRSDPRSDHPRTHLQELALDKSRISLGSTIAELVQLLVTYGGEGFGRLMLLLSRPDALPLLTDLARSQVLCVTRETFVQREESGGHRVGRADGQLRKAGRKSGLLEAIDAFLFLMLAQVSDWEPTFLDKVLRRRPLIVGGSPKLAEDDDLVWPHDLWGLMRQVMVSLWAAADCDNTGKLDVAEARELFRLLLSRPLLPILVRESMPQFRLPFQEDSYMAQRSPQVQFTPRRALSPQVEPFEVRQLHGLKAASRSILEAAALAEDLAAALWSGMDVYMRGCISGEEFKDEFQGSFSKTVLTPLSMVAIQRYESHLDGHHHHHSHHDPGHEKVQDDASDQSGESEETGSQPELALGWLPDEPTPSEANGGPDTSKGHPAGVPLLQLGLGLPRPQAAPPVAPLAVAGGGMPSVQPSPRAPPAISPRPLPRLLPRTPRAELLQAGVASGDLPDGQPRPLLRVEVLDVKEVDAGVWATGLCERTSRAELPQPGGLPRAHRPLLRAEEINVKEVDTAVGPRTTCEGPAHWVFDWLPNWLQAGGRNCR